MKKDYVDIVSAKLEPIKDIPPEEAAKLIRLTKKINLKKDEFFLRAGEIPRNIGFNYSGLLRLYYIDNSGKDITKHFCTEGSAAVSYSSFILREPSRFSIQALEDSIVFTLSYENYLKLLASHVCWQNAARKLSEIILILKEKRESELLLLDAHERYRIFLADFPTLSNRIPQYYIASYLNIAPESLSRIKAVIRK